MVVEDRVVIGLVSAAVALVVVSHLLIVVVALVATATLVQLKCIQLFAALAATPAKSPSAQPAISQFSVTTVSTERIKVATLDRLIEPLTTALLAKASSKKAQLSNQLLKWKSSRN